MEVINRTECNDWYESLRLQTIYNDTICAIAVGKNFCQTDVGGPLVVNGTLEGIVTIGCDFNENHYPGFFNRVAYVRDWIRKYAKV